jgi:hypothetical protein
MLKVISGTISKASSGWEAMSKVARDDLGDSLEGDLEGDMQGENKGEQIGTLCHAKPQSQRLTAMPTVRIGA